MIRHGQLADVSSLATLAQKLWPKHTVDTLEKEIQEAITKPNVAFFLAFTENQPIAFAQCQLRHDYVEGTSSSPVGYLEGIYVRQRYRQQGIASELLTACQTWAKHNYCTEFASDCEIENMESLKFHLSHSFIEANRLICFSKQLT